MRRVTEASYQANNGVVVIDPETGELRPAGQYSQNEWTQLSRANPDLATALIENRSQRKDVANAQEQKRSALTFAGGMLASNAVFDAVGQAQINRGLVNVLERHHNSLIPMGTEIYGSDKATAYASAPGVVEFATVEGLTPEEGIAESVRARQAFSEFKKSPAGQKLYTAVPADADPVKLDQKARIYQRMGFDPPIDGVMRMDLRPGAAQFKDAYHLGDRVLNFAKGHPIGTARTLRYGGAALTGLALGGLAHGAWNMINPIDEV